jgi:hypothetical protein
MGIHSDFKRYYRILGLTSSSSSEEIKRAYRRLAKELHPDLHPNDSAATTKLQALNEAYEVLSSPESRAAYDATCIATEPNDTVHQQIDPVTCCSCGAVSAQPRYLIFKYIVSVIFISSRRTVQGIFCASCAAKKAIKASAITWLTGWWGFPWGPIWTLQALFQNLAGGIKPPDVNAKILGHQALHFWNIGRADLAALTVDQALCFDSSARLREHLYKLRKSIPAHPKGPLVNRWKVLHGWGFWAQLMPVLFILVFAGWLSRNNIIAATSQKSLAHAGEMKSGILAKPRPDAAIIATARPFENFRVLAGRGSNGYERVLTHNGTVGYLPKGSILYGDGMTDLMGRCFPNGSVHASNGTIFLQTRSGPHTLTVTNGLSSDAVVKLRNPAGSTVISFYVTADSKVTIDSIPEGTFAIEFATGASFSPTCGYFLRNMSSQRFVNMETFETHAHDNHRYTSVLSLTLNPVIGGTAHTIATDETAFDRN